MLDFNWKLQIYRSDDSQVQVDVHLNSFLRKPIIIFPQSSFAVEDSEGDESRSILAMCHSGLSVWIAMEQSSKVKAFHVNAANNANAKAIEHMAEIKVASVVNKVLTGKYPV